MDVKEHRIRNKMGSISSDLVQNYLQQHLRERTKYKPIFLEILKGIYRSVM